MGSKRGSGRGSGRARLATHPAGRTSAAGKRPGALQELLRLAGRLRAAWFLLPALVAGASYFNLLSNGFVYDEIWTLDSLDAWRRLPLLPALLQGRGLTYLVHAMDAALWGHWAGGFHLTNIVLHALASTLVLACAAALSGSRRTGLLAGVLFAAHPVHTEAVACFAYRKDILALIFTLLALRFWLMRDKPVVRFAGAVSCYLLGLISKEVAAAGLPALLLAADFLLVPGRLRPRPRWGQMALIALPFVALAAGAAWHFAPRLQSAFGSENILELTDGSIPSYRGVLLEAAGSSLRIARLFLAPLVLSADYPVPAHPGFALLWAAGGAAVVALWVAAALRAARRAPVASFGMLWAVVMFLPASNLIPVTRFFAAERYLYVPSFGFCLLLGVLLDCAWARAAGAGRAKWRRLLAAGTALLVLAGAGRCLARGRDWHDGYALWSAADRAGCGSYRVCTNLAYELRKRGDLQASIAQYRRAAGFAPTAPKPRLLLGDALEAQGSYGEAIAEYRAALELHPEFTMAQERLSWMLAACPDRRLRNLPEALSLARRVCERSSYASPRPLLNLAVALAGSGEMTEAARIARRAVAVADSLHDGDLLAQSRQALEQITGFSVRKPASGAGSGE